MKNDKKAQTSGNSLSGDQLYSNNEVWTPRLRPIEKHCPRCNHLLILNELEECTECHYCGYIDCGDEDDS